MSSAPYPHPGPQGPWHAPSAAPQHQPAAPVVHAEPAAGPPAYLDLTVQGTAGWTAWIAPEVYVNGWILPQKYGRSMVPVPPGRVRVDVVVQWTKEYGRAALDLQAAPGQVIPVFYATPYHVFAKGAIGHVKQRRPGLLAVVLPFVVLAGIVTAAVVAAVVMSS